MEGEAHENEDVEEDKKEGLGLGLGLGMGSQCRTVHRRRCTHDSGLDERVGRQRAVCGVRVESCHLDEIRLGHLKPPPKK